jgi:hypothetical protein
MLNNFLFKKMFIFKTAKRARYRTKPNARELASNISLNITGIKPSDIIKIILLDELIT